MYGHSTTTRFFLLKHVLVGLMALGLLVAPLLGRVQAADMPTAAGSPIAGISFDDRPLMLPVQRNFQMAMLTASSELGRSCGRMEAYGWRLSGDEQQRVNQLFNNTVDRLRAQGFEVETKQASSVSRDVTLFTADRPDKHLILMWSAGEIGLAMVLCETSEPLPPTPEYQTKQAENLQPATFPTPLAITKQVRASDPKRSKAPKRYTRTGKTVQEGFTPVGAWVGNYTCSQGTTGATLQINKLRGDQFEGTFSFYPTSKNPYVPKGAYKVFGEYDMDSLRILINPGKWLKRPKNYYSTIMIGSFDPVAGTFSGFFQGITGCTSYEAHLDQASAKKSHTPAKKKAVKKKAKKKVAKKKAVKKEVKVEEPVPTFTKVDDKADKKSDASAPAEKTAPASGIAVGEPTKDGK